jgi:hypothetical protein
VLHHLSERVPSRAAGARTSSKASPGCATAALAVLTPVERHLGGLRVAQRKAGPAVACRSLNEHLDERQPRLPMQAVLGDLAYHLPRLLLHQPACS